MVLSLCQAAAHVNSMHIIAADRVGTERGQPFIGQSVIVGPTGWPLAEPAGSEEPETVQATTDLTSGQRLRRWNEFNDPVADRRPAVYTASTTTNSETAASPTTATATTTSATTTSATTTSATTGSAAADGRR
jgi:hypothetical protein